MSEKQFLKKIRKHLRCSRSKKNEIIRQLRSDISTAVNDGNEIEMVIKQMGSPYELAAEFNESMSKAERKAAGREKILNISGIVIGAVLLLSAIVYWMFPKTNDISDSSIFLEQEVERQAKQVVSYVAADEYDSLKPMMTKRMKEELTEEVILNAKKQLAEEFGEFQSWGKIYMVEINQMGHSAAILEITASYKNVSVTYRLTFDEEMKLAGLYMR